MIGVLDWGIGGLWALRHLRSRDPAIDLIYLSDAGNRPYGLQARAELRDSLQAAVARLRSEGAERVLVACHSGSTAIADLQDSEGVHGVIDATSVPDDARHIVVIGGARTVRSQAWRRALAGRGRICQRIAQPLSAAVEAGRASHPQTRALVEGILRPARAADTVVLGCTHYAALTEVIAQLMPRARIVDPAIDVADRLPVQAGSGQVRALTTGDPGAIDRVVQRALPELVALPWHGIDAL